MQKRTGRIKVAFESFSNKATKVTGRPVAFITAVAILIVWAISGPIFDFSDAWQLVINTGTTIITFLMVFLIQQSQNKDTMAIQLKLNELISATKTASNRLVDIEDLTEDELEAIKSFYIKLANLSANEHDLFSTHSLDEAETKHRSKVKQFDPKN